MRATILGAGTLSLLAAFLWSTGSPTRAEDAATTLSPEEMMAAAAEASQPGAAHEKLEPLVGRWTYQCKVWMDPSQPPQETTGTIERKWILGGRFVEERVAGTGVAGSPDFEAFNLLGYNSVQEHYTSTWACTMSTGTASGRGKVHPSGRQFTFETEGYCPVLKKKVNGRDEIRLEGDDRMVMESYINEGGEEMKVMELVAVRAE